MEEIRILHVEDVAEDFEHIDRILRKSDLKYESLCVASKDGFLSALDDFMPHVILCDHGLPSFSSIAAAKILTEKNLRIPLILVTGTLGEDSISDVIKAGIVDYVLKDRPLRLPSAIKSALEKRELERKKDEYLNTIIQQEKRFRAMIENLSEAIVLVDKDGKIIYHSPSAAKLTGYANSEVQQRDVFSFFHEEDVSRALENFRICGMVPRSTIENSFRIKNKAGSYFWVEGSITNLLDEESVAGYIVNYRDITERKYQQQLLAESEANLRTIFDNTDVSYIFLTTDFKIVSFNQPAVEIFKNIGRDKWQTGEKFTAFLPDARYEDVFGKLQQVLEGESVQYEIDYSEGGSQLWFNVCLLPVFNKDKNSILGIIVSVSDITSRKRIELEREKMTADLITHVKNLEQFAYIVSHNLRSPVANIIGLTAILQEATPLSTADKKRCLEGLYLSAEKLDDVIKDLNNILQLKRDVNEPRERVKLSAIMRDLLRSFQDVIGSENILVKTEFRDAEELTTVRTYLYSILFNLISNGIKYRHRTRESIIEIRTEMHNDSLVLIYKDNGLGIDLEAHGDKIFGLYKRFHNQSEGKGIGLYMVKAQVEMLGGKITVSGAPDAGIEFRITFPL